MRLAMGTKEVLDAEGLVQTYVSPGRRGLRYAYPYYDGLVTNDDPATLSTGDLLAPTLLGVNVSLDRMHTLTALLPLLQRGLDALPPVDLVEADDETCDLIAALYDPLDDPSALDRDVRGSLLAKVLHRKRPGLIPLFDSKVQMFYQDENCVPPSPKNGRTTREYAGLLIRAMRQDLRDNADELAALARLVPADGPPITPLRVLDIVVWTMSLV